MNRVVKLIGVSALSFSLSGCILFLHPEPEKAVPPAKVDVVGREATPPAGVARYCWKEPKVVGERNGPGLNSEGTWYVPAHTAVREVKQGYWVDCKTGRRVELK